MSRRNANNSTPKTSDDAQAKKLDLSDATVGFRAMVSALTRAGFSVHLGYENTEKKHVSRDHAGNFAITIHGAHVADSPDGPVLVADEKAKPENEKTPA